MQGKHRVDIKKDSSSDPGANSSFILDNEHGKTKQVSRKETRKNTLSTVDQGTWWGEDQAGVSHVPWL